ncbi:MAG: precorrin-8X methylmutase [Rhizobiales bacterium]|nr:precorrin-8X methylmutase [Hyphomicrobiales bacterium]MBI3674917.1 precorrin-8X methylmutase [Hyphomicrobiales bacterium]
MIDYLRQPDAIYARSFAIIRAEADLTGLAEDARDIAIRIIHACGMPEIVRDLRISADFAAAARAAIAAGRPILVDAEMVRHGIADKTRNIICTLNDPAAREFGLRTGTTRSAAAVELWRPHLEGSLVVIGNAPTALFALFEKIDEGAPRPAAIAAFPVGFVGAAESKAELVANPRGVPYATLLGRKGGSAMAAAVVNALTQGAA